MDNWTIEEDGGDWFVCCNGRRILHVLAEPAEARLIANTAMLALMALDEMNEKRKAVARH